MPPRLLITVDTELSNFPDGQGLWGRVGSEEWGLSRLIAAFRELDVRATFFLDVYAGNGKGLSEQQRAAEVLCAAGHDLQLHTHPVEVFDRTRDQMRNYSLSEQKEIVEFGCQRIAQWTGRRPVLHRAGDWAADHNTLTALRHWNFRADFSACPWSRNCALDSGAISGNGWTRIAGMLCGVGTCYRDRLTGRMRRLDLGSSSFREVQDILSRRINPLIVTLHSFSLMRHDRLRRNFSSNPEYLDVLRRFCRQSKVEGYQTATALEAVAEINDRADATLPWSVLPTTLATASCAGVLKSVRDRLRA